MASNQTPQEIAAQLIAEWGTEGALNVAEKMAFNFDGIFRRSLDDYSLKMSIIWNEIAGEIVASKVGA
jgi:hypothetical protein